MTTELTVSAAVKAKAERLLAESRVRPLKGYVFEVVGDHGIYIVGVSYPEAGSGACNCPSAELLCSHLYACCVWALANPGALDRLQPSGDPFAGLN